MAQSSSSSVQARLQNILPNMLLSTTYAVNKSNSKRISLGLECHQGSFRPVVKLSTATGCFKSIKFDVNSWKVFKNYFDLINTYFQDAYRFQSEYGRPTKVYMENHDLMFTTSYNTKSILIEERPVGTPIFPNLFIDEEDEEEVYTAVDNGSGNVADAGTSSGAIVERHQPPRASKKQKTSHIQPAICMQKVTFDGLRVVSPCVDERLDKLEACVGKVNEIVACIKEFVIGCIKNDTENSNENAKATMMRTYETFQQYYTLYNDNIKINVADKFKDDFDESLLNIIVCEIAAFKLFDIYKDIYSTIIIL